MNQYSPSDRLPARALSSEKVRVEKPSLMKYGIYIFFKLGLKIITVDSK